MDGALSANNPTELALNEGLRIWPDRNLDYVVSLGTGIPPNSTVSDSLISWASTCLAKATDPNTIHQREKLHFKRIREDGNKEKRYYRLNPPEVDVDLDSTSAKAMEELITLTQDYLDQPSTKKKLKALTNMMIAKGYYISSEIEFSTLAMDQCRATFKIRTRLPALKNENRCFIFNHIPQNNSAPIDKTYNVAEDNENAISIIGKPGSSYETHIQLVIGSNESPLSISGSPLVVVSLSCQFLFSLILML